jgi:N-acyl-D-amino-acid deacylase
MKRAGYWALAAAAVCLIFVGDAFCGPKDKTLQPGGTGVTFDLVIRNALVFDGSSNPAFPADVAIKGDTITQVAPDIRGDVAREIDARGLHLSPGFIDMHSHADANMYYPEHRSALNYLTQGVTSLVVGQCGSSAWPIMEEATDQIRRWRKSGIGPNAALLIGHGSVRQLVLGMENRAPTADELERMKAIVKRAMEQGAVGMSSGLIYLPGRYADTDEVVALVEVIAPYGGIYHTHIRNERDRLLDAVAEAIEISRRTGVRTHISHFKVMGRTNWGTASRACEMVEEARAAGLSITADQYPFRFANGNPYRSMIPANVWRGRENPERLSSEDIRTVFLQMTRPELINLYAKVTPYLPVTAGHRSFLENLPQDRLADFVGGFMVEPAAFRGPTSPRERALFWERYNDPAERPEILKAVREYIENLVGFDHFIVGICNEKRFEGLSVFQVAESLGITPEEAAVRLELMDARCIPMQMQEEDIETIMRRDYVSTGSDGVCENYGVGPAHIRAYVTFLHKIRKYALEREAVSVPHVIRSQTSLPASIMKWADRGWIKPGYKADIAVFDLDGLETPATISNPHQYSKGVVWLLVNGRVVLENGAYTGALPGKVLIRQYEVQAVSGVSELNRPLPAAR